MMWFGVTNEVADKVFNNIWPISCSWPEWLMPPTDLLFPNAIQIRPRLRFANGAFPSENFASARLWNSLARLERRNYNSAAALPSRTSAAADMVRRWRKREATRVKLLHILLFRLCVCSLLVCVSPWERCESEQNSILLVPAYSTEIKYFGSICGGLGPNA